MNQNTKLDVVIRCRAEPELKAKIEKVAQRKHKKFAVFMREELWGLVDREEARRAKKSA